MPVTRMNHAVLYVRDVTRTTAFYTDVLGFRIRHEIPGQAAFLQAPASNNDHDLGIFQIGADARPSQAGRGMVGLYHIAWEVDTLDELDRLAHKLRDVGSLVGASDHGRPRLCTPTIPTAWSSRSAGWCRPIACRSRWTR